MAEGRYLVLALCTHLAWGMYHPVVRYLQNVSNPALTAMYLLGGGHFLSGIVNMCSSFLCGSGDKVSSSEKTATASDQKDTEMNNTAAVNEPSRPSETKKQPTSFAQKAVFGSAYGLLTLIRALTNILSASLTLAFYIQSVSLLNPYVVALFSMLFLGEKSRPRGFCASCFVCMVGSFFVIAGENITEGRARSSHLRELVGTITDIVLTPGSTDAKDHVDGARPPASLASLWSEITAADTRRLSPESNTINDASRFSAPASKAFSLENTSSSTWSAPWSLFSVFSPAPAEKHEDMIPRENFSTRQLTGGPISGLPFFGAKKPSSSGASKQPAAMNNSNNPSGSKSFFSKNINAQNPGVRSGDIVPFTKYGNADTTVNPRSKKDPNHPLRIIAGVFLQVFSILCSALMRVSMTLTSKVGLGKQELAFYQNVMNFVPILIITFFAEGFSFRGWLIFTKLGAFDYALFLVFSLVIFYWANIQQINAVRHLGPTLYSSFQPLRMLSSLLGSLFILHEPVKSWLSWVGIAMLCVTISVYFGLQVYFKNAPVRKNFAPMGVTAVEGQQGAAGAVIPVGKARAGQAAAE
ncbi:unnamed protein product [Amoebophrya sp. A120]|nr:unnamed protein product [Amoebophrya sp. A120]|eukprot:GSA120T00004759001.1